ncbi:uncharacterized protein K444DRAFT_632713 [Hyaloscypha bicolor E]|uniref:Uncharacterized protein n=1 Tax=Hyaloscypha bicolor E TaxID=1095630 RepID=A0A2J6SZV7_9HELO|nr:uncharacterized protein K444DRAFT_632713 [Hyaloscypha bicolor E]PMD56289.1 hypothetical protein K444DRAFT_632713 [Hyaloscypha bicolor E]
MPSTTAAVVGSPRIRRLQLSKGKAIAAGQRRHAQSDDLRPSACLGAMLVCLMSSPGSGSDAKCRTWCFLLFSSQRKTAGDSSLTENENHYTTALCDFISIKRTEWKTDQRLASHLYLFRKIQRVIHRDQEFQKDIQSADFTKTKLSVINEDRSLWEIESLCRQQGLRSSRPENREWRREVLRRGRTDDEMPAFTNGEPQRV